MPEIDTNVFHPHADSKDTPRSGGCIYFGRYSAGREKFKHLLSTHIEITRSWPSTRLELAQLLSSVEYLICFEPTSLATEAKLCGCVHVQFESPSYQIGNSWAETKGFEYGTTTSVNATEIARAKKELPLFQQHWKTLEDRFWIQLDNFVEKTQSKANSVQGRRRIDLRIFRSQGQDFNVQPVPESKSKDSALNSWLKAKQPNTQQSLSFSEFLDSTKTTRSRLLLIIHYKHGEEPEVLHTINSIPRLPLDQGLITIAGLRTAEAKSLAFLNHHILEADDYHHQIRALLRSEGCQWFVMLHAGSGVVQSALFEFLAAIQNDFPLTAIYADRIGQDEQEKVQPVLHSSLGLESLTANPVELAQCWIFNSESIGKQVTKPFKSVVDFNLSLLLNVLIRAEPAHIGHLPHPLILSSGSGPSNGLSKDTWNLLNHYVSHRYGPESKMIESPAGYYRLLTHRKSSDHETVSIILPTLNDHEASQRLIERVLLLNRADQLEIIIVDRGSTDPQSLAWLQGMTSVNPERIRVLVSNRVMGVVEALAIGREQSTGRFLLFIQPDVCPLNPEWIKDLLNHARQPDVAWVAPKIVDSEGAIVSAGRILGLNGISSSPFVGARSGDPGYMGRLVTDQPYSVVGPETCMIRREVFDQILESAEFFEDPELAMVEYSLRALTLDYRNVWTPFARMLRSKRIQAEDPAALESRIKRTLEEDRIYANWLTLIANDPAYNRNFSLRERGFQIEGTPGLGGDTKPWLQVPRVLAFNADEWGCGHYRVIQPFRAMEEQALLKGAVVGSPLHPAEVERVDPEVIVLQRQVVDVQLDTLRRLRQFSTAFKVYELDDYIVNLPLENHHRHQMPREIRKRLMKGLSQVDRFVVSTEALAEAFKGFHPDIRVQKLYLPNAWWKAVQPRQVEGGKPRVGWAGGTAHAGDLALIADVVKELADEVDWVFFGAMPKGAEAHIAEFHEGVEIRLYPEKLASLGLDLALAPLEDNLFNRCKSNLKFLEYGACGYPVIASDIECYRGSGLPVTLVKNRYKDWLEAIRSHLADRDASRRQARELREQVLASWMLDGANLARWLQVWTAK